MKTIAYFLMIIDHIGLLFYPDFDWLRLIGRFSLPFYVFMLVQGFSYTRNLDRYLLRLLFWAVASQFVIWFAFGYRGHYNILFSLALCLCCLECYERMLKCSVWSRWCMVFIWAWLGHKLRLDYGWYIVAITMCYRLKDFGLVWVAIHYLCPLIQGIAVLSPWVVKFCQRFDDRHLKIDWYFAYAFQWVVFSFFKLV